jgi:modulator of FtsH protease HflK
VPKCPDPWSESEIGLMPWDDSSDGRGDEARGPNRVDPEKAAKRGPDPANRPMRRGAGDPGWVNLTIVVMLAAVAGFYAFTFRVDPDELGVVMRFGKVVRQEPPGLHFRMPYPIDEVLLPKVMRQNLTEVGMRTTADSDGNSGASSSVRGESLMLTGDENIVEINFVVFWRIKDAVKFLFNIQNPEVTVKAVAESAMRDIVGQSEIRPLLTGARQKTEQAVQGLMQGILDAYGSGVRVDQVQLQKVDPPSQVIDAYRDVQGAATDKERLQNEAATYASRIVPEARGEAERILQGARGYREQSVAEATGQTARFLKIYDEYKKAPDVTRTRLYLETMERIMAGTDKIIIDSRNARRVLPFLSLDPLSKRKN